MSSLTYDEGEIFGMILSDGNITDRHRYRVAFHVGNEVFATYFKLMAEKLFNKTFSIIKSIDRYGYKHFHIRLNGYRYYRKYIDMKTSFLTEVPSEITDFDKGVIQGYFYGDGTLYNAFYKENNRSYWRLSFCDSNPQILDAIKHRLNLLGITGSCYKLDHGKTPKITFNKAIAIQRFLQFFKPKPWRQIA